jgi:endonuclease/exonuclease/phosphatase family metal-dependent hydrolase
MGLSGYEALIMATASPLLLSVPAFRTIILRNLRFLQFLSLSGMMAFLIPSPTQRVFAVAAGVWSSCLVITARWYSLRNNPVGLQASISAWILGLIASSIAKFAFHTNNPVWPIMHAENGGWNKTGLAFAVLAILRSKRVLAGGSTDAGKSRESSPILAALGFAGLSFAHHTLLSDSSTMILWVWEGFPVRGPLSVPHGAWTIFAMGLGLVLGIVYHDTVKQWRFFFVGTLGATLLTFTSGWLGYYGALILTTYLTAISPLIVSTAARNSPGIAFGFGFLFYNVMVLAHVWTVAYAFVPGGPLLREHTDYVMAAAMTLIAAGVYASQPRKGRSEPKTRIHSAVGKNFRSHFLSILVVLQLLSVSIAYMRFPSYNYTPYHPEEKVLTAGIWTIHFTLDNDMWSSEHRMRDLIKEAELDVVGLLESDTQRTIMGNRDVTQFLAEDLGMYVDYGPGPNKHTWGCALLSKFPILNSTHHLLPSPVGELAPAIHATLDVHGELIDVVVFHSGQEEDPEDRRLQSEYLSKLMGASPRPLILLSYLVTKPKEGNYNTYVSDVSKMKDIDPSDWDRWCEYILYKGLKRTGYARISRSTITDTELQVCLTAQEIAALGT